MFFFLFFFQLTTTILAQTSLTPPPIIPPNITSILEKSGQFNTLIRLLETTQLSDQINNQLNNSNNGLTIFAPTDNAFSTLPPGTLNSLTDQQKVSLMQFHVIPSLITISQFQTVSNPLRTQAGSNSNGQFVLNVTSIGNQVNISTGVMNTTVTNSMYLDSKLAVYQVDRVLLPLEMFGSVALAPEKGVGGSRSKNATDAQTPIGAKGVGDSSCGLRIEWIERGNLVVFVVVGSFLWLNL